MAETDETLKLNLTSSVNIATPQTSLIIYSDDEHKVTGSGVIFGTLRDDFIEGSSASDAIFGAGGNDRINAGSAGADTIDGGAGNDTISVVVDGVDSVDGGLGIDRLGIDLAAFSFYGTGRIWWQGKDAAGQAVTAVDVNSSYALIDQYVRTATTNILTVYGVQQGVYGYPDVANLTFTGVESLDVSASSAVNDNDLIFARGTGKYDGKGGSDTFYADWNAATSAITWVNNPTAISQVVNGTTISAVERLLVRTGSGNDRIDNSYAGNNTNDYIDTGAGNDTLNGGTGADTLTGGDGSDTYYVDSSLDVVTETNATSTGGTDLVYSALSAYTLGANIENGRISTAAAANITGNGLNNVLYAGAGSNVLDGLLGTDTVSYQYATAAVTVSLATTAAQATGGSGSDTIRNVENLTGSNYADKLTGSAGSNVLNGGSGNDTLTGGAGNDVLTGGLGADQLTGGTGADSFDFNALTELGLSTTTRDTITDFSASTGDKIDLFGVDANTALTGNQAFSYLGGVSAFTGNATGKLRFDAAAHILYGSTDADTAAEFAIVLTGVSGLTASSLVL